MIVILHVHVLLCPSNLLPSVSGFAFSMIHIGGLPEQALGWFSLHVSLGLVVEDEPFELSSTSLLLR